MQRICKVFQFIKSLIYIHLKDTVENYQPNTSQCRERMLTEDFQILKWKTGRLNKYLGLIGEKREKERSKEGGRMGGTENQRKRVFGGASIAMLHILKSRKIMSSLFLFLYFFMSEYSCCLLSIILKYIKMITGLCACCNTYHRALVQRLKRRGMLA